MQETQAGNSVGALSSNGLPEVDTAHTNRKRRLRGGLAWAPGALLTGSTWFARSMSGVKSLLHRWVMPARPGQREGGWQGSWPTCWGWL